MPVTVIEMCLKGPGSQKLYVLESIPGVNVAKLVTIAEKCLSKSSPRAGKSKECCTICVIWLLRSLIGFELSMLVTKAKRYPRSNLLHCMVFMI